MSTVMSDRIFKSFNRKSYAFSYENKTIDYTPRLSALVYTRVPLSTRNMTRVVAFIIAIISFSSEAALPT